MDERKYGALSLQRQALVEASVRFNRTNQTLPISPNTSFMSSTRSNFEAAAQSDADQEDAVVEFMDFNPNGPLPGEPKDATCCGRIKRLYHFLTETLEYNDP